jgi:serine/threonine protein kinase
LTDFGISGPAATAGVTTTSSRGTPCYRAPELFKETAKFTSKVDLWALGCILHECVTGSKAFTYEYLVVRYQNNPPQLHLPWSSDFWQDLFSNTIKDLLHKDEAQRPTAIHVHDLFMSYQWILVDPLAEPIFNSVLHSPYEEWIKLRRTYSNYIEWHHELANVYQIQGEERIAREILDEMVQLYLDTIQRLHESNQMTIDFLNQGVILGRGDDFEQTVALFRRIVNYLPD